MTEEWNEQMVQRVQRKRQALPRLKMLFLGEEGVGKTTVKQALFDAFTANVRMIEMNTYEEWLTDSESDQWSVLQRELKRTDIVYYCIRASQDEVGSYERQFIQRVAALKPIILVITQAIGTQSEVFQQYIMDLSLPVHGIVMVMAKPYPIYERVMIPSFGLEELLEQSLQTIAPEKVPTLVACQQVDMSKKVEAARDVIYGRIFQRYYNQLGEVMAVDQSGLLNEQWNILSESFTYFSNSDHLYRMLQVMEDLLREDSSFLKMMRTFLRQMPQITGLTACMVTNAVAMSTIEMMALLYKRDAIGVELTSQELSTLLVAKIETRLKQGKKNPNIKRLLTETGFDPNEHPSVTQRPTIQVHKKTPTLSQRIQRQSKKLMHDTLDTFSHWIRRP